MADTCVLFIICGTLHSSSPVPAERGHPGRIWAGTAVFCLDPRLPSAPPRPPVCFVLENVTQLCVPVTPGTDWGDR
ncbi:unnamed protein product [Boreogadus saida]